MATNQRRNLMKRIDCHLHIRTQEGQDSPAALLEKLHRGGFDGAIVLSDHPASFQDEPGEPLRENGERLDLLLALTSASPDLYPFYWIDPTEPDALAQVDTAVSRGAAGFKVIPNHFFVGEEGPMAVWRHIAAKGKPILFHSGILWDWSVSASFTRPLNFEPLLFIPGLRFAMAHVAWPWCDEMTALYGKWNFLHQTLGDGAAELFVDLTPGTPPSYREEVLTKLFGTGYDPFHIMSGLDHYTNDYSSGRALEWTKWDMAIYQKLDLSREITDSIYGGAALRFVGRA